MTLPSPATFAAGQRWRAADVNLEVRDAVTFVRDAHLTRARENTGQGISNASWTALTFTSTDYYDTDAWHDTSTNTARITPDLAGYYRIEANFAWPDNQTGVRGARIKVNSTIIGQVLQLPAPAGFTTNMLASSVCAANGSTDYFTVEVYQSAGGGLTLDVSAMPTTFTVTWIGA